jgi:UDP-GlcNAc:undecaprenyl-phosphate/decaprenyl-phosphate GlcNAc-1-phosphate transferase
MERWVFLYLIPFIAAGAISFILTPIFRRVSVRWKILHPVRRGYKQDIHRLPMPLLGGLAIISSFFILVGYYAFFTDQLTGGFLLPKHLWGILIAGIILTVGGTLDDKYDLKPKWQFVAPVLAIIVIIASGIGIDFISNPLGETFRLDSISFTIFEVNNLPYQIVLLADIFTAVWLLGMIFTAKYIDGVDGLSSSIMFIGFLIIFFLSITQLVAQPETAFLAIVMAGAVLGFWPYHFPSAKLFVGEGGVLFMGFMLGLLAIISGGKIATALLVMGIPIVDTARVISGRLLRGRSPFQGDDTHLHHLLLKAGLKQWQVVLAICLPSLGFGIAAVVLQGSQKILALGVLFLSMVVFVVILGIVVSVRTSSGKNIDS